MNTVQGRAPTLTQSMKTEQLWNDSHKGHLGKLLFILKTSRIWVGYVSEFIEIIPRDMADIVHRVVWSSVALM